ncbi:MAG: hypothetical protein ACLTHL_06305 [Collinsella sp.]
MRALDAGEGVAVSVEPSWPTGPDDIDRVLERAGSGALRRRRPEAGTSARRSSRRAQCAWEPQSRLPGYAEKQARGMFPGIAKTDAIDAEASRGSTALGVPRALRPAPEGPEGTASLQITVVAARVQRRPPDPR